MQKIVIIGCNSFTGGYVVDELLMDPNNLVIGIDRVNKDGLFVPYVQRLEDDEVAKRWSFHQMDVNNDGDAIIDLIQKEKPQYVMNLAALSEVAPSWEHPEQWFQTNVVALTHIVDGIKDLESIKMFTQISTPEVYGSCEGLVKEDYRINPSTPYAASKAAFDLSVMTFHKNYNFPVNFTRAANVYGAHQQLFKIIPRAFIYIKMNKKIPLHGGGTSVRSFTHVRDVAKAYIVTMLKGEAANVYHISTDTLVEIRQVVQMIAELLGKKFEDVVEITESRRGHDKAYTLDWSKIRNDLGWTPEIELEDGLNDTHEWVEKYWREISAQPLEYIHKF